MKVCENCGQVVAEEIAGCPTCGGRVDEGLERIDDYLILEVIHEGHSSILCRALKEGTEEQAMVRIFTPQSPVNDEVAYRLKLELEEIKKLPPESFVQHREFTKSSQGLWYRVSEWIEAERWGDLISRGVFNDYPLAFDIFYRIAANLELLHQTGHFMPHLIMNDIMIIKDGPQDYQVKIDYKLSRFLDPHMDQPSPMLERLLDCHPDIQNDKPLDFRSDIWSLGKIFMELFSADFDSCAFTGQVDQLPLPYRAKILLKSMLAEDPDLRPGSMAEVAEMLARIRDEESAGDKQARLDRAMPAKKIRGLRKSVGWLAAVVSLVIVAGLGLWFYSWQKPADSGVRLEQYAARYSPAVAFVLVEYGLRHKEKIYFQQASQGTAFLVDDQGHLLTSRHVACPWLENSSIFRAYAVLQQRKMPAEFFYKQYVWFEGQKAFNLAVTPDEDSEISDLFYLENAYISGGDPGVEIAGVPLAPSKRRQAMASPLRNDFAVLKLSPPPQGISPLPMEVDLNPLALPRLSRVIALGFPLGRRTQESTVNVSATWGHVRRTFKNMLQVDAAVYEGNSGGPVIGIGGKVIGIATGVASKPTPGNPFMPSQVTPLWNIGMVLPINKAAAFLGEIKTGRTKWNGLLDLEVDAKLKRILDLAQQERWSQAQALSESYLEKSRSPKLIMAGGIINLCTGDLTSARELLSQSLSIDRQDNPALFLLFLTDWLDGKSLESPWGQELFSLDWRSSMHFSGYMARVLSGKVDLKSAADGWDNPNEKGWLYYLLGLLKIKQGEIKQGEDLLRQAVLSAHPDDWVFYLALSTLGRQLEKDQQSLQGQTAWNKHLAEQQAWRQKIRSHIAEHQKRQETLAELYSRLAKGTAEMAQRLAILKKINELVPEDRDIIAGLAYMAAMDEDWQQTKDYIGRYMKRPGRQSIVRLVLGLMDAELSHIMGKPEQALAELENYLKHTTEPWFRSLAQCLLGRISPQQLKDQIGSSPQNLLTFNLALGLWAEGEGKLDQAKQYYRSALESLLDDQLDYELVKSRLKKLRKKG